MEDVCAQDFLDYIAASKKLKLSDATILGNITEMLENINKDTKARIEAAKQQAAAATEKK